MVILVPASPLPSLPQRSAEQPRQRNPTPTQIERISGKRTAQPSSFPANIVDKKIPATGGGNNAAAPHGSRSSLSSIKESGPPWPAWRGTGGHRRRLELTSQVGTPTGLRIGGGEL